MGVFYLMVNFQGIGGKPNLQQLKQQEQAKQKQAPQHHGAPPVKFSGAHPQQPAAAPAAKHPQPHIGAQPLKTEGRVARIINHLV
jgi:hypothetical protein